ncbi:MAG TPA: phosphate ABC transporter permease subunit PstC [Chloroflexia bacterium]|nr:phosphate ABC transporter permease subunit PstC [Chloroflexia bacterium]
MRTTRLSDRAFALAALLLAGVVLFVTAAILLGIVDGSQPTIGSFGFAFITGQNWDPVQEEYGALPFIYGTLVTSFSALLMAGLAGVGAAIFLAEIAPGKVRTPLSFMVELLAGIPSIVYGIWGLFVLAPLLREDVVPFLKGTLGWTGLFQGPFYGPSVLTASVVLALMVLPIVTAVSRDVLLAVPANQREAMLGLGATRWEVIRSAVLPYARSGILGALILGLGRAVGETMAVTMVIGNRSEITASLLKPGNTMASVIANEFAEATTPFHQSALIEVGLLLFVITLITNMIARALVWRAGRGLETAGRA